MLFRKCDGSLIEININDYLTDSDYYNKIINLMMED